MGVDGQDHDATPQAGLHRIVLRLPFVQGIGRGCATTQIVDGGA